MKGLAYSRLIQVMNREKEEEEKRLMCSLSLFFFLVSQSVCRLLNFQMNDLLTIVIVTLFYYRLLDPFLASPLNESTCNFFKTTPSLLK